jgi:hypothetical protein
MILRNIFVDYFKKIFGSKIIPFDTIEFILLTSLEVRAHYHIDLYYPGSGCDKAYVFDPALEKFEKYGYYDSDDEYFDSDSDNEEPSDNDSVDNEPSAKDEPSDNEEPSDKDSVNEGPTVEEASDKDEPSEKEYDMSIRHHAFNSEDDD